MDMFINIRHNSGPYPGLSLGTPVLWKCRIRLYKRYIVIHLNRVELHTQACTRSLVQLKKGFFANNFCVFELYTLKFLTQKETMVTQIFAGSASEIFIQGKVMFKKKLFTFQQFVSTCHVKLRRLNQKVQVWIFYGQDFAFRAAINISCKEITSKRVKPICFLCLIN